MIVLGMPRMAPRSDVGDVRRCHGAGVSCGARRVAVPVGTAMGSTERSGDIPVTPRPPIDGVTNKTIFIRLW